MLIDRQELWGKVFLDITGDEIWAEVRKGAHAPRIDRPLSASCWLGTSSSRRSIKKPQLSGPDAWLPVLDQLRQAGLLRLNFAGFESVPRGDLHEIVSAGLDRGIASVISALECTPDLEKCLGLDSEAGLQVLFDLGHAWRAEQSGELSMARRFQALHQCVAEGMRLRVLTPYDPYSPMPFVELGESLALLGIEEWLIFPRHCDNGRDRSDAALLEIQSLREDFPYMEIRYGNFFNRELDLLIRPDGSVRARGGRRVGPPLFGTVDQLLESGWLPETFLDRHVDLWVSGTLELNEPEAVNLGKSPDVFLSYNRQDRHLVVSLRDQLEHAGIRTWLDDSLEPGDLWSEALERNLEQCPTILVCFGPSGLGPFQQTIELPVALGLAAERQARIIPVLLPGLKKESDLPRLLRPFQFVDLRRDAQAGVRRLIEGILHREGGGQQTRESPDEGRHPAF